MAGAFDPGLHVVIRPMSVKREDARSLIHACQSKDEVPLCTRIDIDGSDTKHTVSFRVPEIAQRLENLASVKLLLTTEKGGHSRLDLMELAKVVRHLLIVPHCSWPDDLDVAVYKECHAVLFKALNHFVWERIVKKHKRNRPVLLVHPGTFFIVTILFKRLSTFVLCHQPVALIDYSLGFIHLLCVCSECVRQLAA